MTLLSTYKHHLNAMRFVLESICIYNPKIIVRFQWKVLLMSQSIPTGYIPPGNPWGLAQKHCPGSRDLTFEKLPGGREFDKGGDFVEIQSVFCPCIGFISDKYRVSQKLLNNGEQYIVDFQFKLR